MLTLADVAASGRGKVAQCKGAVMDYQIVLSPEFKTNPDAFLSAWNDDVDCRNIALAERVDQPPAGLPIDPGTVLSFLGGVQWWQTTGLVEEVFYFGCDEKAYTCNQIVDQIARRLLNQTVPQGMAMSPDYAQFQTLMPALQQRTLARRLRAERHLVILDNLESITGASLAIPNTLLRGDERCTRCSLDF
jgi:hypothetical protein